MENQSSRIEKICAVIFLVIGVLTILEYIFIKGMFTAPLMILLSAVIGIVNIVVAIIKKKPFNVLFYILLTVALNMGYLTTTGL